MVLIYRSPESPILLIHLPIGMKKGLIRKEQWRKIRLTYKHPINKKHASVDGLPALIPQLFGCYMDESANQYVKWCY